LAMLVGTGIIVIVYLVSAELLKPLAVRSRHDQRRPP
jgi:P-type Mg2+ transporter